MRAGFLYPLARALLFRLDPEAAHGLSLQAIARVGRVPGLRTVVASQFSVPDSEPVDVFGLHFPNRIGLAAGYDKDGDGWRGLACLGFGHIEVGTATPEPQAGNPKPRVFRVVEERSVAMIIVGLPMRWSSKHWWRAFKRRIGINAKQRPIFSRDGVVAAFGRAGLEISGSVWQSPFTDTALVIARRKEPGGRG